MIELYYGRESTAARKRLLHESDNSVLIVAPNDVAAVSIRREICTGPGITAPAVISFDELLDTLIRQNPTWQNEVVSNHVCRAIFRNVLELDMPAFDYLVGENAVPRISQGVITRLMAAADALTSNVDNIEVPRQTSPRTKQLRLLAQRFEDRLTSSGLSREKHATWQGIIDLNADQWQAAYPHAQQIVFTDFDLFPDEVYLAIAATSKQVQLCRVLLDFDPDDDRQGASAVAAAFPRLCDMATLQVGPEPNDETEPLHDTPTPPKPLLVKAPTVTAEIAYAVRVIFQLTAAAADESSSSPIVVAVGNSSAYAGRLEKALGQHALRWQWFTAEPVIRSSEVLFIERLRACAAHSVTGAAVSDLLRSPGIMALLDSDVTTVEAWDLASRLDYILAITGLLTGWKSILHQVERAMANLHAQRRRTSHWTDDEKALDDRLLTLLKELSAILDNFMGKKPVVQWAQTTADLLQRFQSSPSPSSIHLQQVLQDMGTCSNTIAPEPIPFPYFISLFRTALQDVLVEPTADHLFEHGSGPQVVLCDPATAAWLTADHCILLGFNDGAFPRFTRVDVSFFDGDNHKDQRPVLARQWHTLRRIFTRYHSVQLWMPEREGTEELLPSQFAELLIDDKAVDIISAEVYVHQLKAPALSPREQAEIQLVENLQGLELTETELTQFKRYGQAIYSAARGITVTSSRSAHRLSIYDGILTDPRLKSWLSAWIARHTFSVSQLDGIVGCSFRFFAERMLNLDEIDETDGLLPAHVFGSFAHDVLARFYRGWVAAGRKALRSMDEALAREQLLRAYHAEYDPDNDLSEFARDLMTLKLFGTLGPDGFGQADPPLAQAGDAGILGQFLLLEMQRGDDQVMDFLHPANFEVGFGVTLTEHEDPLSSADCIVMDIGNGNSVKLWGRIDRIDVSDTGVFAVTDYKTGHLPTGTQIAQGFRTQLPIYMLVAQELLSRKYQQPQAAGGLYYSLKRGKGARISGAFVRAAFQAQLGVSNTRGMSDERFEETLSMVKDRIRHSMNALRRGYLTTTHHDPDTVCRFCEYHKLCYRNVERTAAFWEAIEAEEQAANA